MRWVHERGEAMLNGRVEFAPHEARRVSSSNSPLRPSLLLSNVVARNV